MLLLRVVRQEVSDVRHMERMAHVHFIISVVETVITVFVIVVQMLNAHVGYIKVRQAIERFEDDVNADVHKYAHVRSIRVWMWLMMVVGVVYLAACIACFLLFYHLSHLGWTLLSNQVFIVTMTVLLGLYTARVAAAVARIKEDQHKVTNSIECRRN